MANSAQETVKMAFDSMKKVSSDPQTAALLTVAWMLAELKEQIQRDAIDIKGKLGILATKS